MKRNEQRRRKKKGKKGPKFDMQKFALDSEIQKVESRFHTLKIEFCSHCLQSAKNRNKRVKRKLKFQIHVLKVAEESSLQVIIHTPPFSISPHTNPNPKP
jgi:hypothetical protein